MSDDSEAPRWTLPPRRQISPDNLHLSSFVIVKKRAGGGGGEAILLLRAGDKHPLTFRRGKLVLPAIILEYGEKPRQGARRALKAQLQDPAHLKDPVFSDMQSYFGAHWDIVFLFEAWLEEGAPDPRPREPYVQATFHDIGRLPRREMSEDHLEVIDAMLNPAEDG